MELIFRAAIFKLFLPDLLTAALDCFILYKALIFRVHLKLMKPLQRHIQATIVDLIQNPKVFLNRYSPK